MGGPIDIEQKGWKSALHDHDSHLLVTKLICKDLLDANRCDFRCLHAVNLSSYWWAILHHTLQTNQTLFSLSVDHAKHGLSQ